MRLNMDNRKEERSSEKRFQTTFLTQTVIITPHPFPQYIHSIKS
ncbi:hypothetical protein NEIFLAOT_00299 [Neisseria flavescens NRL30031/H210]|uniref:Uncharacterized protein n=1 Tax=Neisseria flavescens NRL30031/H210 TaxID=546264 RepID=C0EK57_NEIFL|nr:hypothetical protein NEIFLAOT_00299 [Neisseria flavescens NRL30031/H210]